MANLKGWILKAANGEAVEGVVIGEMGWGSYGSDGVPNYAQQPRNRVLTWQEALPWIDYEFEAGYGAPGCNAVYAWTASRVLFVSQYDGSTCINSVPRNPGDVPPVMPGG